MNYDLLKTLAEKHGLPLFVYDSTIIKNQFDLLKNSFPFDVKIKYACKALSNISILKFLKKLQAGLDAVSVEEIKLGLLAGFSPEDIVFTPSSADFEDIVFATELGVRVHIDDLYNLELFAKKYGSLKPVGIRFNPLVFAGGNDNISTGHINSKFGILKTDLDVVLSMVNKYGLVVDGLHVHTGSDILDVDKFLEGVSAIFSMVDEFSYLKYLDLGSGFKVKYKEDDLLTDVELLGKMINEKLLALNKNLSIFIEPGKFLVSNCGFFLVKCNTIKNNKGKLIAGVNSGFNHFIRPMFYDAYHEVINLSNLSGPLFEYDVVGYICEEDTLAKKRFINEIKPGNILCFRNAGAYCFSMSSNYNSKLRPAEVLIHEGRDFIIRERESLSNLLMNQKQIF